MKIGQSTWSHQTVVLSERDGSEEEISLTQSSFGGSLFFIYFFIKFSISILRLQTFRLNRFYERKWKGQDIVKLILCPLLDEVNLF